MANLQPPEALQLLKRKSQDGLNLEIAARTEEKKAERQKKAGYVKKPPRMRKHYMEEQHYCCKCEKQSHPEILVTVDEWGKNELRCGFAGCLHMRCHFCMLVDPHRSEENAPVIA